MRYRHILTGSLKPININLLEEPEELQRISMLETDKKGNVHITHTPYWGSLVLGFPSVVGSLVLGFSSVGSS